MKIKTGKDVRIALVTLGLTQAQLADRLRVTTKTISGLCNGERVKPVYALAIELLMITDKGE